MTCRHWWYSPLGWTMFILLQLYVLFMHSHFWTERQTMWGRWQQQWETEWQEEQAKLTLLREQWEKESVALLQHHQDKMAALQTCPKEFQKQRKPL